MVLKPLRGLRLLSARTYRKQLISVICCFLTCVTLSRAQQAQTPEQEGRNQPSGFFQKAETNSIFIFGGETEPCMTQPGGQKPVPLGSGFVVGMEAGVGAQRKFLVTSKHVLANEREVVIRLNSNMASKFLCQRLSLQDAFFATPGVDLAAVSLPEIPGLDPAVIPSSLLIDAEEMISWDIGAGADVLTVGYLLGYDGQKIEAPVAKFARISLLSEKWWYHNPESRRIEQAYAVELSSSLELSGAPIFAHGVVIATNPFQYRQLPPFVIGVVKGLVLEPVKGQFIYSRIAVIEPGKNLKALMQQVAETVNDANREGPAVTLKLPMPALP
jgi:hypothetical protein